MKKGEHMPIQVALPINFRYHLQLSTAIRHIVAPLALHVSSNLLKQSKIATIMSLCGVPQKSHTIIPELVLSAYRVNHAFGSLATLSSLERMKKSNKN